MNGRLLAVAWCCWLTLGGIALRGYAATPGEELLAVAG